MNTLKFSFFFVLLFGLQLSQAQPHSFTKNDTLRGSITPQRDWWDLTFYDLKVKVDPVEKKISGSNEIRYTVLNPGKTLQIDLQPPLRIESVEQDDQGLSFVQKGRNAYYIELKKDLRRRIF